MKNILIFKDKAVNHNREMENYDVIVVGAGHAGMEASLASCRIGAKTLLLTINTDQMAYMPCNPAMGGPGKTQVLCELHALGGASAILSEESATSIRLLNRSKGPSVQSVRIQADRHFYSLLAAKLIGETKNLTLFQGMVSSLLVEDEKIVGVVLLDGRKFYSKTVVLSCGTYMSGKVHYADTSTPGGRMGQPSVNGLSEQLKELGLPIRRFNTGTTPRIDAKSIDYSELARQDGDTEPIALVSEPRIFKNQLPSWLGHTNSNTMNVIKKYVHLAPSVKGMMVRTGPRSCPSLEEKARWYADRTEHLFFVEPESRFTNECYLQGLYMSIPPQYQLEALKTLPGLSNVRMVKSGYAIDYDFVDPTELNPDLSTKHYDNLFLAGQVDGTTGYDEAAALGLVAGANAALKSMSLPPLILGRMDGYIGVMIDDLAHKGITEPYRITPSHVEFRMSLRADNAIFRLGPIAKKIGLLDPERSADLLKLESDKAEFVRESGGLVYYPDKDTKAWFQDIGIGDINEPVKLAQLIRRPHFDYTKLIAVAAMFKSLSRRAVTSAMTDIAIEAYCQREQTRMRDLERWEKLSLPEDIDYAGNMFLSKLARLRLAAIKPKTLGEAMRVDGVTPSDIQILGQYVSRET